MSSVIERTRCKMFYEARLKNDETYGFEPCSSLLDLKKTKIVLKFLADLHSSSLIYEETNKIKLDEENDLIDFQKNEFNFLSPKIVEDLEERQSSSKFRRTINHGNLIPQNILFKNEECRLINYKNLHVPKICDVLQLLFFNTDEEFRREHFEDSLLYYHECLSKKIETSFEEVKKEAHNFLPLVKLQKYLLYRDEDSLRKFEEDLSSPISREDCYTIAKTKTGSSKFHSFSVGSFGKTHGFLANYHKLRIESEETMNFFIKSVPKNQSSLSIIEEAACFTKEVFIYQTLVPEMVKLGVSSIRDCLPRCFFQRSEELLVFEDLSSRNFRIQPTQIPYDFRLLTLVLKKLAKYHASMVVFEERANYNVGEKYEEYLREAFFTEENHSGGKVMQVGLRAIPALIDSYPEFFEKKKKFQRNWDKLQKLFFEAVKPSKKYRNVVNQGDLWANNIMVQFEEEEPVDCVFIDYQNIRYCPPAHDYLSVVYLTTDRSTRAEFGEECRKIYYEELKKALQGYGYAVEEILPFREFTETIDYIRPQLVLQAVYFKGFILCTSEEMSSLIVDEEETKKVFFEDRRQYLVDVCAKSPFVKNSLRECILDLFDLCDSFFE